MWTCPTHVENSKQRSTRLDSVSLALQLCRPLRGGLPLSLDCRILHRYGCVCAVSGVCAVSAHAPVLQSCSQPTHTSVFSPTMGTVPRTGRTGALTTAVSRSPPSTSPTHCWTGGCVGPPWTASASTWTTTLTLPLERSGTTHGATSMTVKAMLDDSSTSIYRRCRCVAPARSGRRTTIRSCMCHSQCNSHPIVFVSFPV